MTVSTYMPGTFLFVANPAGNKPLTDTDLNAFGTDLLNRIASVTVPPSTSYILPAATNGTLGGIKASPTIAVATDGTASLGQVGATNGQALLWNGSSWMAGTVAANYTLPIATTTTLGGLKPDGTTITVDGQGVARSVNSTPPLTGVAINGSTIPASNSSPYQMQTADRVIDVNKTTGAATSLLLPINPTLWVEYTIIDGKGDAGTNAITIAGASGTTINGAANLVINGNNSARSLRAVSATTWRIT